MSTYFPIRQSADTVKPIPQDEQLRLSIMHQFFLTLARGQLFVAPLKPERLRAVLDVGTGTGDWAMELAE